MSATQSTPQRMLLYILFLLSLVHFLELSNSGLHLVADDNTLNDMSIFMAAGKQFVRTGQLYVRSNDMGKDYAPDAPIYKFPPTYQLTIVPFLRTGISDVQFLYLQHLIYILLYIASIALLIHYANHNFAGASLTDNMAQPSLPKQILFPLLIVACWYSPFAEAYLNLHTEILILFLLTLTLVLMEKHPLVSGAILASAFLLKIYPGFVLLYFLLMRNGKAIVGFLVGIIALLLVTIAYFGIEETRFYVGHILPVLLQQPAVNHSQNLMIEKFLVSYNLVNTMNGTIHIIARTIALLVLFFIEIFRRENLQQHFALYYGMVICAALIWLPNYWLQYQMLLIIPLFLLFFQLRHSSSRIMLGMITLLILIQCAQEQWIEPMEANLTQQFNQLQLMNYLPSHDVTQTLIHSMTLSASFVPIYAVDRINHFLCDAKALTPYLLFVLSSWMLVAHKPFVPVPSLRNG